MYHKFLLIYEKTKISVCCMSNTMPLNEVFFSFLKLSNIIVQFGILDLIMTSCSTSLICKNSTENQAS